MAPLGFEKKAEKLSTLVHVPEKASTELMVRVSVSVQQLVPSMVRNPMRSNSNTAAVTSVAEETVRVTLATFTSWCSSPRKPDEGLVKDHPGCCGWKVSRNTMLAVGFVEAGLAGVGPEGLEQAKCKPGATVTSVTRTRPRTLDDRRNSIPTADYSSRGRESTDEMPTCLQAPERLDLLLLAFLRQLRLLDDLEVPVERDWMLLLPDPRRRLGAVVVGEDDAGVGECCGGLDDHHVSHLDG